MVPNGSCNVPAKTINIKPPGKEWFHMNADLFKIRHKINLDHWNEVNIEVKNFFYFF